MEGIVKQTKKIRPLGSTSPYAWAIEPSHGCNLRCGHCCRKLDPLDLKPYLIDETTWRAAWSVLAEVTPTVRADVCGCGEPTLHPELVRFLSIARELAPQAQIQVTTNGTMIKRGAVSFRELLDAGANIVYADMYGDRGEFRRLAVESGYPWYEYYNKPADAPSPWTYWGPHLKVIVLQEHPENWPASRRRAGLLGTWYNHLDWSAASRFGLIPIVQPPVRRCNQPFVYVPIDAWGRYLFCCQDGTSETGGMFGSVIDGVEGFKRYWYGREMQIARRKLRDKDRASISPCSRCGITFSRCDYKRWTDEEVSRWWDGASWQNLEPGAKGQLDVNPA
jgi:hypothetical protein